MWYVYICEKGNKLYTGMTTSLANRMRQHGRPKLIHSENYTNKHEAASREKEIKGWSHKKKLALAMANPEK